MQVVTQVSTMQKTRKMMSTKLLVVLLILTGVLLGQTPVANGVMSHEEAVVRGAYARLSCAAEIGHYWHGTNGKSDSLSPVDPRFVEGADQGLRFELSHFQVGSLESISSLPWTSLVSGPIKILNAEYHELPASGSDPQRKEMFASGYADVTWNARTDEDVSDLTKLNQGVSVAEYVRALQQPTTGDAWTQYASYTVMATFGQHRLSYRATFLFSGSGRMEEVWPLDYATAMTIAPFLKARVCATNAAKTLFRLKPILQARLLDNEACRWLKTHNEECCDSSDRCISKQISTGSAHKFTLPCAIDACNKTGDRLPSQCPAAGRSFSEDAGTMFNTTTDSRPEFNCTWICVHETRPEWRERHGPWALFAIDGDPISQQSLSVNESGGYEQR
jgi:hypothetical protein